MRGMNGLELLRARRRQPARRARDRDDRVRQPRDRRRGDPRRARSTSSRSRSTLGAVLAISAVERAIAQRGALRDEVKRLRDAVADRARTESDLAGRERGDAARARPRRARRRRLDRDHARARRERHREGARRAGAPRAEPARERPLRGDQLRGDARGPARERALRPREGRLHRRAREEDRAVRRGVGRHPVPRRDRRHAARRCRRRPSRARDADRAQPVGGSAAEQPFDARVVAATRTGDLEAAIEERPLPRGSLLPPRRRSRSSCRRSARAPATCCSSPSTSSSRLAAKAGARVTGFSAGAAERLLAYSWPGNVRELQNCIERAVALARYEEVLVDDLPEKVKSYKRSHVLVAADDPEELASMI